MTDLRTETVSEARVERPAGETPAHHRHVLMGRGRSLLKHALLILASLVMIYPLLWMLVSSFRPTDVIFRSPGLWVNDLVVTNYTQGWNALGNPFGHYLMNSALVVIGAVAGNLLSCSLAAYAFARLRFRLKTLWFSIMLVTIMLPIHVVVVPQYILFNQLGWVNTFIPLVLPKFMATDAFFVFSSSEGSRGSLMRRPGSTAAGTGVSSPE
jgi:multiple sugar transport system permease protein